MPQQFQVLRCYKCSVFQVHQTTKSKKWECKLCGEKQSFKRFYGIGTAKDCRFQVQKLNSLRGLSDEVKNTDENRNISESEEIVEMPVKNNYTPVQNSKWSNYVDETETVEENNLEDMHLGVTKVVLEIPIKRRKQSMNNFKKNPVITPTNRKDHTITSQEIVPNSLIISKEMKPNPSQASFHTEESISGQEPNNKIIHNKKKFVPPPTNKNSKWAQFTDEPHETEQTDPSAPLGNIDNCCTDSKLTPQNEKFSWSDDDIDLESILGI